ncbi:uroporphyrinogen-III synthase [Phreatobacter cathodiphilus]|uniref:Uroporphyrinogen III synthase n=1 Tax=Phreatobacter cathodiphilus TaxID=1868589 RepID=A0A2S0NEZ7_9HYPH|nr:uroporphyrinogen-III synthase [Phreatobacter cathodiphilus]AVO46754.1 uroporphyrinogen III synthase [Phreatobacter cathodiphilus]
MRVLVTRPEPEAARTVAVLASLGHEALVAPLFTAEPVAADLGGAFDALAVTSARTTTLMPAEALAGFASLPAFAVGDRTAEALAAAGFVDIRPAAGDVEALAALIAAAGLAPGARILHPGGEERAGDLAAALAPAGLAVIPAAVYRMRPAEALPGAVDAALRAGTLDAVLHYSPRAAELFAGLSRAAGRAEEAAALRHLCLSPAVAAALEPLRPSCVITAQRPREADLLAAL